MSRYFTPLGIAAGLALMAAVALPHAAHGAFYNYIFTDHPIVGGPLAIPDNGYPMHVTSDTQLVSNTLGTIVDVNVVVWATHTFIGDLTFKLQGPDGTTIRLLDRPGIAVADDGTDGGGDDSNLSSAYGITFDDAGLLSSEVMGSTPNLTTNQAVGNPVNGSPSVYQPMDALSFYNGLFANGVWTLMIGDSTANAFTGSLLGWQLQITTVPEPASLILFAAGAGMWMWRRRRNDADGAP